MQNNQGNEAFFIASKEAKKSVTHINKKKNSELNKKMTQFIKN